MILDLATRWAARQLNRARARARQRRHKADRQFILDTARALRASTGLPPHPALEPRS